MRVLMIYNFSFWATNDAYTLNYNFLYFKSCRKKEFFMAKWLALCQGCNQTAPKWQYKWCNVECTTLHDKNYKSWFDAEIDQGALRGQIKMKQEQKPNTVRRSLLTWFQTAKSNRNTTKNNSHVHSFLYSRPKNYIVQILHTHIRHPVDRWWFDTTDL